MSSIKLTADSGGGSVSLKAPATTTSNAALEITVPDVATGSSVVTANSSGTVGIGTTSPAHKLHVEGSASGVISAKQTTNNGGYNIYEGDASDGTTKFYVSHNGRVGAAEGVIFGSDTAAANVLDGYEEGTFTPTYEMTTSTGTFGYNIQQGRYTKIGNMVHFQIAIQANSHSGTNSGMLQIAGLPFGVGGTWPQDPAGFSPFFISGGNFDSAYGCALQINQSEKIEFYRQIQATGNNYDLISSNELTLSTLFIKCSGFYMTT